MAKIMFCGWEAGDTSECAGSAGTFSVQATTKRTGGYALRVNPTASANSQISLQNRGATGVIEAWTSPLYVTCYINIAAMPSGNGQTIFRSGSGSTILVEVRLDTNGDIYLHNGTTASTDAATLVVDTWYRIEIAIVQNGTCRIQVNGGTEQTLTGANNAPTFFYCGTRTVTSTYDIYYDDICFDGAALPGAGQCFRMDADGAGTYTAWTGTYADVDEVPHDSDTTTISTLTENAEESVTLESGSAAGLVGTPTSVLAYQVVKQTVVSQPPQTIVRLRSGSTNSDSTSATMPSTYASRAKIYNVDPATSAAWVASALDSIEVGIKQIQSLMIAGDLALCTLLCAMVWEDGVAAGADPEGHLIGGKLTRGGLLRRGVLT